MMSKLRSRLFRAVAVAGSLYYLIFIGLVLSLLVILWLSDDTVLSIIDDLDPGELVHRVHEYAVVILAWGLFTGVVLQIHRPRRKVAPMLQAVAVPVVVLVFDLTTSIFTLEDTLPLLLPVVVVAALHPEARRLLRFGRPDRSMLALSAVAAVPWTLFAISQTRLQARNLPGDVHLENGHWAFMASFAVVLVAWALIGASDLPGWRFTAWAAGIAPALYGGHSLAFSHLVSAASPMWAVAAISWGAAYIGATELRARRRSATRADDGVVVGVAGAV
jgi:hypothetical protein